MPRYVNPVPDYPYAESGFLEFFVSNTTTQKDTFSDVNETLLNPNPVPIEGDGKVPNIFFSGTARVVCTNAQGVQQWERDPVEASGGGAGTVQSWNALTIYSENDIVLQNDEYYRSLTDGNQNNDPTVSASNWVKVQFIETWNPTITYGENDLTFYEGEFYNSTNGGNLNNNPGTSNEWIAQGAEAAGIIPASPGLTFDGKGVASITRPSTGIIRVTFDKPAITTTKQLVLSAEASPNGIDVYQTQFEYISETVVEIGNWFVNTATGAWTLQDNPAPLTLTRALTK